MTFDEMDWTTSPRRGRPQKHTRGPPGRPGPLAEGAMRRWHHGPSRPSPKSSAWIRRNPQTRPCKPHGTGSAVSSGPPGQKTGSQRAGNLPASLGPSAGHGGLVQALQMRDDPAVPPRSPRPAVASANTLASSATMGALAAGPHGGGPCRIRTATRGPHRALGRSWRTPTYRSTGEGRRPPCPVIRSDTARRSPGVSRCPSVRTPTDAHFLPGR